MRRFIGFVVALPLALIFGPSAWAATQFVTTLDAAQENHALVDPVNATGQGSLTLVDLGGGDFRWDYDVTISPELSFSDITGMPALDNGGRQVTGFHIHRAARGADGGVVYGLFGPSHNNEGTIDVVLNADNSTTFTGFWGPLDGNPVGNINDIAVDDLLPAVPGDDVDFYFNVHTAVNQAGESRGQIVAIPEPAGGVLLLTALAGSLLFRRRRRVA